MSGPKQRFSVRLQCWVTPEIAAGYETLAADGMLDSSDWQRLAHLNFLRQQGVIAAPQPAKLNGHQGEINHRQAAE